MNQLPWWAIVMVVVAFVSGLRGGAADPVTPAASESVPHKVSPVDALWRRYYAIQQILTNQSRRVGELDATLGVLLVVEFSGFVWYLDKAYTANKTYAIWIAWSLLAPIVTAGIAAVRRTDESPKAGVFFGGLDKDEAATVSEATVSMVRDFERNRTRVRYKEAAQLLSVAAFILAFVVDGILTMLKWG